jgi:hypothetical protein
MPIVARMFSDATPIVNSVFFQRDTHRRPRKSHPTTITVPVGRWPERDATGWVRSLLWLMD